MEEFTFLEKVPKTKKETILKFQYSSSLAATSIGDNISRACCVLNINNFSKTQSCDLAVIFRSCCRTTTKLHNSQLKTIWAFWTIAPSPGILIKHPTNERTKLLP